MSLCVYKYSAVDSDGARVKGVLRAADAKDAYRQMVATGLKPIRIDETTAAKGGRFGGFRRRRRASARDLAHLTYQFSVFMQARIPISDGLRAIAEQERNLQLKWVIEDIARQVESGSSITESMMVNREMFGDVYIETIRAAEQSGNMIKVLNHLAEMLDHAYEASKRLKGALMYPILVVATLGLAILFLTMFVVPRFATMFAARGLELPLPTQLLMAFSGFVREYWYALLGAGAAAGALVRWGWRSATWRPRLDGWLHRIPVVRDMLRFTAVARFAHILGLTLQSGLSLIDALEMAGRSTGRPLLQLEVLKMQQQVNRGGSLSDVVLASAYLPGFARRMIVAGVEAAEVPRMCEIIARHYDREMEYLTKNIATLIEPILIVGLAAIVLIVALAFFLPMWNMGALIG